VNLSYTLFGKFDQHRQSEDTFPCFVTFPLMLIKWSILFLEKYLYKSLLDCDRDVVEKSHAIRIKARPKPSSWRTDPKIDIYCVSIFITGALAGVAFVKWRSWSPFGYYGTGFSTEPHNRLVCPNPQGRVVEWLTHFLSRKMRQRGYGARNMRFTEINRKADLLKGN
jgi:hypothetical protein